MEDTSKTVVQRNQKEKKKKKKKVRREADTKKAVPNITCLYHGSALVGRSN